MRKFLSLEGGNSFGNGLALESLSLEEEAVLVDEANTALTEANADMGEADHALDVSEALDDLAVIAEDIDEATPTEVALIENVAQAAVAGTDVGSEEIVPAMESYIGKRISTESLKDTARNIWASIQQLLKRIWKNIEEFFYKIFGSIPAKRRTIKALRDKLDDMSGKVIDQKSFTVSSGVSSITVDDKALKSGSEVKSALDTQVEICKWAFNGYSAHLSKIGENIADAIADFDATKAEDSAKKVLAASTAGSSVPKMPGEKSAGSRFPGRKGDQSAALLGNVSVFVTGNDADMNGLTTLGALEMMRSISASVHRTSTSSKDTAKEVTFTTMTTGDMKAIVDGAEKLLDVMEDWKRGSKFKDNLKARDKLEKATSKAQGSFDKVAKDEDNSSDAAAYFRGCANMNKAFANWVKDPQAALLTQSLTHVNAVLMLVSRSMGQYKTK